MGDAIIKLMRVIGTPSWFQGCSGKFIDDKPALVLYVNTLLSTKIIKAEIPVDIDGIGVLLIYKKPESRFYGKDGSSIR